LVREVVETLTIAFSVGVVDDDDSAGGERADGVFGAADTI